MGCFNFDQLNQLIATYGKDSPNYNPEKRPYIVTDFDNTSVFLDIEEATLIYQLEHLAFNVTPEQLNQIIRKGISSQNFEAAYNTSKAKPSILIKSPLILLRATHGFITTIAV